MLVLLGNIVVQVVPPFTEDSHLETLPVTVPLKVNMPLFAPEHTMALGPTVPPALVGLIVTVCMEVFGPLQPALLAVMTLEPLQPAT
jgi:hypothetical protein